MKRILRKAKILPDEQEKKKEKKPKRKKKSVPSAPKTISTSTVIYTAAVRITRGRKAAPAHAGLHVQAVTHTLTDYHRT